MNKSNAFRKNSENFPLTEKNKNPQNIKRKKAIRNFFLVRKFALICPLGFL